MKFKPFDKNTSHHWATLMSWFQVMLQCFSSDNILYHILHDMTCCQLLYKKSIQHLKQPDGG